MQDMQNIKDLIYNLTNEQFRHLRLWISSDEKNRRVAQEAVTDRENEIATEYRQSQGEVIVTSLTETDEYPEWYQPAGAHNAWPIDSYVAHNGKNWRNIAGVPNVWEPGNDGPVPTWEEVEVEVEAPVEEDPPTDEGGADEPEAPSAPDYVQPTGGHDAYGIGDQVTFNGQVYESTIDGNVWTPTDYPAGWTLIG